MKEFINPPLNYTGSKYKLLEQMTPLFDYSKTTFIDLFSGGGSVYSNVLDRYDKVIANDIISDLIGIHQNLYTNSESFIEETKNLYKTIGPNNKEDKNGFLDLRESYNTDKTPAKLWALMLSSTNNMMRFNKKFLYNQTFGKRMYNAKTQEKVEKYCKHIQSFDNIKYISSNFNNIPVNPDSMIYIDPPYGFILKEDGSMGNRQISEAGYNCYWDKEDEQNLYDYIIESDKKGSSFMISGVLEHKGETCWILSKLIEKFEYKVLEQDYKKVARKVETSITKEIIVYNYSDILKSQLIIE